MTEANKMSLSVHHLGQQCTSDIREMSDSQIFLSPKWSMLLLRKITRYFPLKPGTGRSECLAWYRLVSEVTGSELLAVLDP